jgi:hypothetical protein
MFKNINIKTSLFKCKKSKKSKKSLKSYEFRTLASVSATSFCISLNKYRTAERKKNSAVKMKIQRSGNDFVAQYYSHISAQK